MRQLTSLDRTLATGGALLLGGIALGRGLALLPQPLLRGVAPVTALAVGWIGAALGGRFDRRVVRRIPRGVWLAAVLAATAAWLAVALAAWLAARAVPALGAAWTPRLPAVLALAAVAAAGAVPAGRHGARDALTATLEIACAALALTVPLALHRSAGNPQLGWAAWIVFAAGSGALAGMVFLSVARVSPGSAARDGALVATLQFGAGIGYAAGLSPFIVCALAAALIVNVAPPAQRRAVRRLVARGQRPAGAVLLVIAGAALTLPTAWILLAGPLAAALRIGGRWAALTASRRVPPLAALPRDAGLRTAAQDGAALALGLSFFLAYGGAGGGRGGGAVLTTVVLAVAAARLVAPRLAAAAGRMAPQPLTRPLPLSELSAGRSSGLTT